MVSNGLSLRLDEGEHTAVVVIPFTLCSLLLCRFITRERARVAHRPPLATRAPGKKIAASRYLRLIPFGFRVGRDAASMQVAPSRRIPAPRPGLQETPQRFQPDLGAAVSLLFQWCNVIA